MDMRKSWCGLCHSRCGLLLGIEGGRAVSVRGNPDHPFSRGRVCQRGALMLEHLYNENRLNVPLMREGNRGEGAWRRISWDDALDQAAQKLLDLKDIYGPETLAFSHGTYRTYHWDGKRFFNLFGSPNMTGANHICMCPTHAVDWATYGSFAHGDIQHANLIVVWGHAPSNSYPIDTWGAIKAAKARGATIMVIDPRRTREAEMADLWLQIKPGTDLALMLGWLKVIVEEERFDKPFVEAWTVGFPELREQVKAISLEQTARVTWIPQDVIVESARMYAMLKPAIITFGLGIDKQGKNANQAQRARAILRAITGNLDVPGGETIGYMGDMKKVVSAVDLQLNEQLTPAQKQKQLGADRYRLMGYQGWDRIIEAGRKQNLSYWGPPDPDMTACAHPHAVWAAIINEQPYPVKALIIVAANPLLTLPNPLHIREALKKLELLIVVDYYLTPTAQLADYIFPAASTVERSDLVATPGFCIPCPKGIGPLHERRPDYDFWRGLGLRCGQEGYWPWETIEGVLDYRLAPLGFTFDQLAERGSFFAAPAFKKYEKEGFGTASGKVEIVSSICKDLGYDSLPVYKEIQWPWDEESTLILITGSGFVPMHHSEQRQWPTARKKMPDPLVTLHPEAAAKLGLCEGEWVEIETPFGRIKQKLALSDAIHPRMADVQHGWWFPEQEGKEPVFFDAFLANANILCPDSDAYLSPEIGSWPLTGIPARVKRAS